MDKSFQIIDNKSDIKKESSSSHRLRTSLLLMGSAIFGGLAVAFWNRRTLAKMQGQSPKENQQSTKIDENAIY
jgi:cytoskeletal protein RodZ